MIETIIVSKFEIPKCCSIGVDSRYATLCSVKIKNMTGEHGVIRLTKLFTGKYKLHYIDVSTSIPGAYEGTEHWGIFDPDDVTFQFEGNDRQLETFKCVLHNIEYRCRDNCLMCFLENRK